MDELSTCDKVFITPDSASWNPHSEHYSLNEEAMMDGEGNIIEVDKVKDQIVDQNEIGYCNLPSVNVVETSINNIIENVESNHDFSGNNIGGFGSLQDLDSDTRHLVD